MMIKFKCEVIILKAVGIICEYNPMHNGHLYHIKKVKELYPDYAIILVMSGNFTQRGDVSLIDKWKKCDVALNYVDLVVELPFVYATQAADIFTKMSCEILKSLNVSAFVFGSESNDVEMLKQMVLIQQSADYQVKVRDYLDKGFNYPTSMSLALKDLGGTLMNKSNDLLGLGYVRGLQNSNIEVKTIKRTNDYNSLNLTKKITSARSIRQALREGVDIKDYVPSIVYDNLKNMHFNDDYFDYLRYKIITDDDLSKYLGVDEGIEGKIKGEVLKANNLDDLIKRVKSKRYTYAKISRMFLHILCGFTKDEAKKTRSLEYIRVLGFNDKGQKYLKEVRDKCDIPILVKYEKGYLALDIERRVSLVYHIKEDDVIDEYKHKVIIH